MEIFNRYYRLLLLILLGVLLVLLYGYSQNGRYRRAGSVILDTRTGGTRRR